MNPYFMKKACEAKDPVERFKYVITNTISSFYYITMFLKPVKLPLCSLIQSLEKHCKVPTLMELKYIANRSPTILPSATSWLLALKTIINTMDATISQLSQALTQCH